MNGTQQFELFVPDRFDMLQDRPRSELNQIVFRVDDALNAIDVIKSDINAAGRGGFLIFYGSSGSGKSTFLNTLGLFSEKVEVFSITAEDSIQNYLRDLPITNANFRVVIIEGRDALKDTARDVLEAAIHSINAFIRTPKGRKTLVVWPVNAARLEQALIDISRNVGGDSLLGVGDPSYRFGGPPKEKYLEIANQTIATLNGGATLADLGVADTQIPNLLQTSQTIGYFLGLLRKELLKNEKYVKGLIKKERYKLWIVVASGSDVEGDISGLTRGVNSSADISRLMSATNANVVLELKKFPERFGILSTVLDAKILNLPTVSALSIARTFADAKLLHEMAKTGFSTSGQKDGLERIKDTDIARAFSGDTMGTRTRGSKAGSNTIAAFERLASIASNNDILLNAAIGEALKQAELIQSYETEKDLGTEYKVRTDIACSSQNGPVRLEIMWRANTGRAEIANYSLSKLFNYGKAIGLLT